MACVEKLSLNSVKRATEKEKQKNILVCEETCEAVNIQATWTMNCVTLLWIQHHKEGNLGKVNSLQVLCKSLRVAQTPRLFLEVL